MSTDCFVNISAELKAEILKDQLRHKATKVFKNFYGYLALPFALIGLGITIVFVLAVVRAIKQHRVSRKCYVLIVNRSLGDILACVAAIANAAYVFTSSEPNRDVVNVIDTFFVSSFWSGMISYVALSLLKLYAVARPFNYRKRVTMKRCIYLVVVSWCFFLFILTYALGVSAITKIPVLREWSGCKIETCLRSMYRTRNVLMCIIYFFTIFCFACTVMFINRARNFVNSFHQRQDGPNKPKILRNRFPMWKLAVNVGTFAGFNSFYIIWAIVLLANTDRCMFQRNYPTMMRILALIRLTLICRIILDPVLSFLTDFQIRRSVMSMFGIKHIIKPSDSKKPFQKSMSEENSSENTPNGKPSTTTVEERLTVKGSSVKKAIENMEV
uniref:G-protein coupled receptors family 1 profile domain-containing protein n=1 Tax=Panagrolaimus sp. JU765 TaxID=591449 RepID=A0AC34QEI1_9BILA